MGCNICSSTEKMKGIYCGKHFQMIHQTKIVADLQDYTDWEYMTIEEAREKLLAMWEDDSTYEFETEEEHEAFLDKIRNTEDWEEMDNMLQGCDYSVFEDEEELREWAEEVGLEWVEQ